MPGGSPSAFLLWSILSVLFFVFHLCHLWNYDKFHCLKWNQFGRQPGAFKRFMSYTYLATLICLVFFSVVLTFLKFQEGYVMTPQGQLTPMPLDDYSPPNKKWVLPLLLVFSVAWGCELVTHLEEFAFWLFLQNQGPATRHWFESGEYRFWLCGALLSLVGVPLTTFVSRRHLDLCFAWTLLVGSSASTATSLAFLYVLWRFPAFIRRVKDDGAAPNIVLRLVFFYQLNVGRIINRFLFSLPFFVLSLDGVVQGKHPINSSTFWPDFLLMTGGIGSFVSSALTLLIFFPRSLTQELGYTIISATKSPPMVSMDIDPPPVRGLPPSQGPASPKDQVVPVYRVSSEYHSSASGHDASPEYEPEDTSNVPPPGSFEGDVRLQAWQPHEVGPSGSEAYVFDRHSRGLVRSRSEGQPTALHPYVRVFRSPIDLCDVEALDDWPDR